LQVVVLVTEQEAARLLRQHEEQLPESSVLSVTRQLGATIAPQHPDVHDPTLSRYFVARLAEGVDAERLVDALSAVPEVEGAYVKPDEEPAV
jgi:hypothetical protein